MSTENQLQEEFIEKMIISLSQIPLSGHRKSMRALSSLYKNFVYKNLENTERIDFGIKLFELILSNDRLFMIKGIKNLLVTILDNLYFLFEKASDNQKSNFLKILISFYEKNKPNGMELELCDALARKFSIIEAIQVFQAMTSNPFREEYFSDVFLGTDILYRRAKDDKKETIVIDKFVRSMQANENL